MRSDAGGVDIVALMFDQIGMSGLLLAHSWAGAADLFDKFRRVLLNVQAHLRAA